MRCLITLLLVFTLGLSHASSAVLIDIDGNSIPFDRLRGQWVFINYWAGWCQPCLDEISELNQFYQEKKGKLALYAVNFDGLPVAEQKSLMSKVGIQYPALSQDPDPELGLGYIRGVPVTFVFNPRGELADTLYGGQTLANLNKAMVSNKKST